MGFKLKKKNTDGSSNRSGGNALVAKLQSQTEQFSRVFGDSEKSKPLILGAAFCIVLAIFLLLYLFYSVPRNNEFTRSLGDLRLLSQTISRQATEATASGTPEAIKKLTESQKSFAENLETVKDIHASTDALREVDAQWKKVSENIDLIASQQKIINPIHMASKAVAELCDTVWDQGNEYFPATSFQVSNIQAGTGATNVVPGTMTVTFNFRYSTELTAEELKARVLEILDRHGLDYDIKWTHSGLPFLTPVGELVNAAKNAIRNVTGVETELSTSGGTSDGRFIAPTGAQVLELGVLNASIHQIDEHVNVADLEPLAEIYEQILEDLLA